MGVATQAAAEVAVAGGRPGTSQLAGGTEQQPHRSLRLPPSFTRETGFLSTHGSSRFYSSQSFHQPAGSRGVSERLGGRLAAGGANALPSLLAPSVGLDIATDSVRVC